MTNTKKITPLKKNERQIAIFLRWVLSSHASAVPERYGSTTTIARVFYSQMAVLI